jgi:hypothetical protein
MIVRRAHTQPHTHMPHKSCSYCYHPSHRIDDCPFINHYMIDEEDASKSSHEHVQTTTILGTEEKVVNKMEEKEEQIEPPPTPNLSSDKELSTEAHSFITIPLETFHEPQVSFIHYLKEPSHSKTLKDQCKQASKSRNHCPRKILLSNKVG